MKGIPAIVLATLAVLYSLIVLLSVDRTSNSASVNQSGQDFRSRTAFHAQTLELRYVKNIRVSRAGATSLYDKTYQAWEQV
jgi:hypothetical protein